MGWRQGSAIVLVTLTLAAFAPPQVKREPAQQEPQKSWIPEQKTDGEPPVTALVDPPKQPSAYRHPDNVVCLSPPNHGSEKAAKAFVESYSQARTAISEQRYEEALILIEKAAEHAQGGSQWMAIESMRIIAFSRLKNDVELIASLEAALSTGCLSPAQVSNYKQMLDGARGRLADPSKP